MFCPWLLIKLAWLINTLLVVVSPTPLPGKVGTLLKPPLLELNRSVPMLCAPGINMLCWLSPPYGLYMGEVRSGMKAHGWTEGGMWEGGMPEWLPGGEGTAILL